MPISKYSDAQIRLFNENTRRAFAYIDEVEIRNEPSARRIEVLVTRRIAQCVDELDGHPWQQFQRSRQGSE